MKITDIAKIKSGLVLKRKENPNGRHYNLLSARYVNPHGEIYGHEDFHGDEGLDDFLTHEKDIVMKIAFPNYALYIEKQNENLLISSYFFILRCTKEAIILPEYLCVFLNSEIFADKVKHDFSGTTVKAIKASTLADTEIPVLPIPQQMEIIKYSNLVREEKKTYELLAEKKNLYHKKIICKMIGSGTNGHN